MSSTQTPWKIDSEVGDLSSDYLGGQPMLTYLRYNVLLDPDWLNKELSIAVTTKEARQLAKMDKPKNVERLAGIGDTAAAKQIRSSHFPTSFDRNVVQSVGASPTKRQPVTTS
jgi:hypothetical protein